MIITNLQSTKDVTEQFYSVTDTYHDGMRKSIETANYFHDVVKGLNLQEFYRKTHTTLKTYHMQDLKPRYLNPPRIVFPF